MSHYFYYLTQWLGYRNIFVHFLVQMKTSKSHSEINWPLEVVVVVVIVKGVVFVCHVYYCFFSVYFSTDYLANADWKTGSDLMGIFYFDKLKRITKTLWQQNGIDMSDFAYDFLSWSVSIKKSISWGTL